MGQRFLGCFLGAVLWAWGVQAQSAPTCNGLFLHLTSRPPLVQQTTDYTCGPAALLSFLRARGISGASEASLAELFYTNSISGTAGRDMVRGLKQLGLSSKMRDSLSLSRLAFELAQGKGIVANIQTEGEGHWVLVFEVGDVVRMMDPWVAYMGYRELSPAEFESIWYGGEGQRAALIVE